MNMSKTALVVGGAVALVVIGALAYEYSRTTANTGTTTTTNISESNPNILSTATSETQYNSIVNTNAAEGGSQLSVPTFAKLQARMPNGDITELSNYDPAAPAGTVVGTYSGSDIYQAGTVDYIMGSNSSGSGYVWVYPLPFYVLQTTTPNANNYIAVQSVT